MFIQSFRKVSSIGRIVSIVCALVCAGCDGGTADIHYVAIGASDATGVGASPVTNGYVFRIEHTLEDKGKETDLLNLGIPGADTDLMRETSLPLAKAKNPDLVTIFAGANDLVGGISPQDFEQDLRAIIQQLTEETQAFIVVATIPDATQAPRFINDPDRDVTRERLDQFNAAILREAAEFGASVADLRNVDVGGDVTSNDGFHPNDEGYKRIAEEFLKIIEPHFGVK